MTNSKPKVSVGLPVYNGEEFLERALESLLGQDFTEFEIIISDNGSRDHTEEICRRYVNKDKRVSYYRNEVNRGAAWNFNRVFDLARGEYFKWAAHDDECHRKMLRRCVEFLDNSPKSVTMVYPLAELINEEDKTILSSLDHITSRDPRPHRRLARVFWSLNMCDPVFGLIKTEYLRKTQLVGPFFGADNVLLGELAILGQIWELDEVLFRLRAHPGRSMKANPSARARAEWYNPSAAGKLFVLPNWERMIWEMMKSVLRSPLEPGEKVRCCMVVLGVHYWRRFRNAGGRFKRRLKGALGGFAS